jgi:hypothetical protein
VCLFIKKNKWTKNARKTKKNVVEVMGRSVPEARGQGGPDAGPMAGPLAAFCGGAAEGWGRRTRPQPLLFDELDCQKLCITQLRAIAMNAHRAARDQVWDLVIQLRRSARRCRLYSDLRSDLWVRAPRRGPFDHRRRRELVALVPASRQSFQRRKNATANRCLHSRPAAGTSRFDIPGHQSARSGSRIGHLQLDPGR